MPHSLLVQWSPNGASQFVGSNAPCTAHSGEPLEAAGNTHKSSSLSVTLLNDTWIILANPKAMSILTEPPLNNDPLKALDEDELAECGTGQDDADIFRNLSIIEDMEMSAYSFKRKRKEDGDDPSRP